MARRMTKKQKKQLSRFVSKNFWLVMLLIVIIVAFLFFAYYKGWLDKFFKKDDDIVLSTAGGYVTSVENTNLTINFLDVGQGDSIIIELPDGKNMIIDSGPNTTSAKNAISKFTTENDIKVFDYILLTHKDSDHVGNMNWVIDNYDVKYIFRPNNYSNHSISQDLPSDFNIKTDGGLVADTQAYAKFMVSAYNEKCPVEIFNKDSDFSNKIIFGDNEYLYTFDFLTPTADKDKIVYSNANDYSPIMTLSYMGRTIMFTGDAEEAVLEEYVSNYGNSRNIDVLKVGHHGSTNATNSDFINAIDPEYAIIQCGLGNSYKHPHKQTLDILSGYDENLKIYRNDTNGFISLSFDKSSNLNFSLENTDCSLNLVEGESMPTTLNVSFDKYISNCKLLAA